MIKLPIIKTYTRGVPGICLVHYNSIHVIFILANYSFPNSWLQVSTYLILMEYNRLHIQQIITASCPNDLTSGDGHPDPRLTSIYSVRLSIFVIVVFIRTFGS